VRDGGEFGVDVESHRIESGARITQHVHGNDDVAHGGRKRGAGIGRDGTDCVAGAKDDGLRPRLSEEAAHQLRVVGNAKRLSGRGGAGGRSVDESEHAGVGGGDELPHGRLQYVLDAGRRDLTGVSVAGAPAKAFSEGHPGCDVLHIIDSAQQFVVDR